MAGDRTREFDVMSERSEHQLREDAIAIWRAGVDAVLGDRLVVENVRCDDGELWIGENHYPLDSIRRVVVVGGGKAGAAMAVGLESALANLPDRIEREGWVNIPEGTKRDTSFIHLHEARPAGRNEPTPEGVAGVQAMLELIADLGDQDLCITLISGGGSALMPSPIDGISLEDKLTVTQQLSSAGANIEQLNTVRKSLSRIKGGGLAKACKAQFLETLIISDVLGDPLDVIASGPTVPSTTGPQDALDVLRRFDPDETRFPRRVYRALQDQLQNTNSASASKQDCDRNDAAPHVIGNLAVAVDAAGVEAERRGYSHAMQCAIEFEGTAESVGKSHARMAWRMLTQPGPDCLITGGEPTVELAPVEIRGRGGRNQQLVLAALQELRKERPEAPLSTRGLCMLSGGTDGEDGPTEAAGGLIDPLIEQSILQQDLDVAEAMRRNDAYTLLDQAGGLLVTGATHANVCDLRVVVTSRRESHP